MAIVTWMRTYRDLLKVRNLLQVLPVGSNHHNVVCHRMAFADMDIRSSALVILGAAPGLGTGVWGTMGAAAVAPSARARGCISKITKKRRLRLHFPYETRQSGCGAQRI